MPFEDLIVGATSILGFVSWKIGCMDLQPTSECRWSQDFMTHVKYQEMLNTSLLILENVILF